LILLKKLLNIHLNNLIRKIGESMAYIVESDVEEDALSLFEGLGYTVLHGPDISPFDEDDHGIERATFSDVILNDRLTDAIKRLNPDINYDDIGQVIRKLQRVETPVLLVNNHDFHNVLIEGMKIEIKKEDGSFGWIEVKLIDLDEPENNDFVVVNQLTVIEGKCNRRPDIVVYINGLPIAVIELKNPIDENATIWSAFNQLQTYKKDIPTLFNYNEVLVISDGLEARLGSLSADKERFMPWRTIEGEELAPATMLQLEVLIKGVFDKTRFLDFLKYFIVFEEEDDGLVKKIAGYHQYHAVNQAVHSSIEASRPNGDRRAGVVWHTQGSGKSLTMAFYSGKIVQAPEMENPTLVIITDRNDLDDQLFDTFSQCHELLRQKPTQAETRSQLRELLNVASGGVVFTTIQKFLPEEKGDTFPLLSDRRNIMVLTDEAHRSQYDFIDGFARHMRDALPNASFMGFTGTPIEVSDRNTRAVFGEYISIYDIQRSVEDNATVPIFYEGRLAKLELDESLRPTIDAEFDELTENEEEGRKTKLKRRWSAIEKIVGSERRVHIVAQDIVDHFEKRQDAIEGKAMIVCMSRRICVDLYNAIIAIRPSWHSEEDLEGTLKVVMTGSASDPLIWQQHIRNKKRRKELAKRFKNPSDEFKLVIVRDMWLTGFDAKCLSTMYIDKPMHGHTLMQSIARVNRVFRDKPGGLIVDYLGIADDLKRAMRNYTESEGQGDIALDQEEAVAVMLEKYEICCDLFHGFDRTPWVNSAPSERLRVLPPAIQFILEVENGKERLVEAVTALSKAFALSVPHEQAIRIRDDVGFFQAIKTAIVKYDVKTSMSSLEMDAAIKQIVSKAITSDQVIDIFSAAGLKRPDISILSEDFLAQVKQMPHKNLAVETLRKLLNDEIRTVSRKYLVQSKEFSKMLEEAVNRYRKHAITSAEAIEALIQLAKEMREANARGEDLGFSEDELAFYDALEVNDSAVKVLGDETLRQIALELAETIKNNIAIDWTMKESVKAKLRTRIKRVLRKHGYPPDKQEKAIQTVIQQAELICSEVAI